MATDRRLRLPRLRHPTQLVAVAFALAVAVSTALLCLPVARSGPGRASFVDALFTATSSVCVTGLSTVDTPVHWSPFGLAVILASVQVGGFGIMAMASLLGLLASRRIGLRSRLNTGAESKALGTGDVRALLRGVARTMLLFEVGIAIVLALRWWLGYDESPLRAVWLGVFHSVTAFNHAGFALFSDNLVSYATDPVISLALCVSVVASSLGFPVLFELRREWRTPRSLNLHSKVVLAMTGLLLAGGWSMFLLFEWSGALGGLGAPDKLLVGFFQGVQARTAGFNSVPIDQLSSESLFGSSILMFIGGASGGPAGGIKVTTFAVLLFVIVGELRGDRGVTAFSREVPREVQRQALTVALLAVAVVVGGALALLALTPFALDVVLYEVVSAFATVGLSTGITSQVGTAGQVVLVVLMFLGRLGTVTLGSALALRARPQLYDHPKEGVIIG